MSLIHVVQYFIIKSNFFIKIFFFLFVMKNIGNYRKYDIFLNFRFTENMIFPSIGENPENLIFTLIVFSKMLFFMQWKKVLLVSEWKTRNEFMERGNNLLNKRMELINKFRHLNKHTLLRHDNKTSSKVFYVSLNALFPQTSALNVWMMSLIVICTRHQLSNCKWRFRCKLIQWKELCEKQDLSDVIFCFRCYYTVILSLHFV